MISFSVPYVNYSYVNHVHQTMEIIPVNTPEQQPPTPPSGPRIRTILNEDGVPSVVLSIGGEDDVKLIFSPDAGVEVALNLLSASYAARAEQALYVIGKKSTPPLSVEDLIKWMRTGK